MSEADLVSLASIEAAAERIAPLAKRTPVFTSRWIDQQVGAALYFKCENLQRTGSFKIRGASNAILSLPDDVARRGIVTHSSGNHGAAVACAAQYRGIPAQIVIPRNAPVAKQQAAAGFGGQVVLCEPTLESRQQLMSQCLRESGGTLIHPYDDDQIIAGQGTATLELLAEVPGLTAVIAPVSGGGLLSGTAIAAHGLRPDVTVYGAEPAVMDDARRSLASGQIETNSRSDTMADGLRAVLSPRTLAILQAHVGAILTVSEAEIAAATRLLWQILKLVVEPSGAVPFAAVWKHREQFAGHAVGILLSGGNLDLDVLPWQ